MLVRGRSISKSVGHREYNVRKKSAIWYSVRGIEVSSKTTK